MIGLDVRFDVIYCVIYDVYLALGFLAPES